MANSLRKAVVTGGGGFLGKTLCTQLRAQGCEVVSVSRGSYPELHDIGVRTEQIDISRQDPKLIEIFRGVDVVFHTAAHVAMWGKYDDFYRTNVTGTKNIITACREAGVKYLVYTSSPSVIADGSNLCGINESYPYPKKYHAYYPQTKALAEQEVLRANCDTLKTETL